MHINELSKEIHQNAVDKGFWDKERNMGEMLMLIVSELSEALEAHRIEKYANWKGYDSQMQFWTGTENEYQRKEISEFEYCIKDSFEDELADVAIRLFDLAHGKNIDLEKHILAKMNYNKSRDRMHNKAY